MALNFTGEYSGNDGENIVPRAVIVIGGTPTIPLSYSLTMNDLFESDGLEITIPSDLIDLSLIFKNFMKNNSLVPIELWSGFLPANSKQHLWTQAYRNGSMSNEEIKQDLLQNYKELLNHRWSGILKQFELEYNSGDVADITSVSCEEIIIVMQRYIFEYKFEGDNAHVESIIQTLNSVLTEFYIEIDDKVEDRIKKYNMGTVTKYEKDSGDETVEEKTYTTVNKTLWDILQDVMKATGLTLIQDFSHNQQQSIKAQSGQPKLKYLLKKNLTSDTAWILERTKHFSKCKIRNGRLGKSIPANVAIRLKSVQDKIDKKDKKSVIEGTFPKELNSNVRKKKSTSSGKNINPEGYFFFEKTVEPNLTKEVLEGMAYDYAQNLSKTAMNGDLTIPNAITTIQPNHLLMLTDNSTLTENRKLSSLVGNIDKTETDNETQPSLNFRITSIKEQFSEGVALTQDVEFELDLNINTVDLDTGEIKGFNLFPKKTKAETRQIQQLVNVRKNTDIPSFWSRFYDNLQP